MSLMPNLISDRFSRSSTYRSRLSEDAEVERRAVLAKIEDGRYSFEERPCAVCESRSFEVLAELDRYRFPIQTTICAVCGLIQTNPDMGETDYEDFYLKHYRKLYIADLVGTPEDFFREERWRGQAIVSYVTRRVSLPPGSLVVEIGCGAGGILAAFAERGYRVIGTDYGEENMAYGRARGLDLRSGSLSRLELPGRPALIIYSHVLEHIREPGRELGRVRELLGPDGFLYVEVPGVKAVHRSLYQSDFLRTFHLAHIYNFTLRTLSNLLAKHGFEAIAGDESVRSLFKPGIASDSFGESDYAAARRYISNAERWRTVYAAAFRCRVAAKQVLNEMRAAVIHGLRRAGLYNAFRKRAGGDAHH
jgi:SAM-dependent methyltransferase